MAFLHAFRCKHMQRSCSSSGMLVPTVQVSGMLVPRSANLCQALLQCLGHRQPCTTCNICGESAPESAISKGRAYSQIPCSVSTAPLNLHVHACRSHDTKAGRNLLRSPLLEVVSAPCSTYPS